jgi:hypothetical protein
VTEATARVTHPAAALRLREALTADDRPVYRVYRTRPFADISHRRW